MIASVMCAVSRKEFFRKTGGALMRRVEEGVGFRDGEFSSDFSSMVEL